MWRGALLLADFLLHSWITDSQSSFKIDETDSVVELGAGTGLTSVVAGMVAGKVASTGKYLLKLFNHTDVIVSIDDIC